MTRSIRERKALIFHMVRSMGKVFLLPIFKLKTGGQENLPSRSGFILLPKHQRWEDIPLLGLALPRPLYYMAKYELFLNPLSSWFLSSLGGLPLNRSRPIESRQSLRTMMGLLERGEGVVIFPEGTYHRNKMGPGQVGLIKLILSRCAAPFIPVGISYSAQGARTWVRINFGRPIYGGSSAEAVTFLNGIMKEIAQLSGL